MNSEDCRSSEMSFEFISCSGYRNCSRNLPKPVALIRRHPPPPCFQSLRLRFVLSRANVPTVSSEKRGDPLGSPTLWGRAPWHWLLLGSLHSSYLDLIINLRTTTQITNGSPMPHPAQTPQCKSRIQEKFSQNIRDWIRTHVADAAEQW